MRVDVTVESDCAESADTVTAAHKRLDVLVNNAGIGHVGTIHQTTGADLDRLYTVNVRGVFNMTKAFIPGTTGHFFQAFDIAQFTDLEQFCAQVRENARRIRTSPPRAGVERTYAPGDIENAKASAHNREGVPLEQFTLDDLEWVAELLGVEYNLV